MAEAARPFSRRALEDGPSAPGETATEAASLGRARELAIEVAEIVDASVPRPVIVLGSLPPTGRDLDLLARAPERDLLQRSLRDAGLAEKGGRFVLFKSCTAYAAELFAAERFLDDGALEDGALEELFKQARPIEGFRVLARPCAAHAMLILARLVAEEGELRPKRHARLQRILAEDPSAWDGARAAAPAWRAQRALAFLAGAAEGRPPPLAVRMRAVARRAPIRRPRRGMLVALSGIDGAGKSSQAHWMEQALEELEVPVEVIWNDLLGNRALDVVAALPKALLALAGRRRTEMARYDAPPPSEHSPRSGASLTRTVWSTLVTAANALEQRLLAARGLARGRVIVFDRSPLDLAVRMQVLYRANVAMQRRLVAVLAPKPDLAFLLDISPEVSAARKDDVWSLEQLSEQAALYRRLAARFGVTVMDGRRPADELAAEIARTVWLAARTDR